MIENLLSRRGADSSDSSHINRNSAEPAAIIADDVRFGSSWSSVTPPAESQVLPTLNLIRSGNSSTLSWTTNAPEFFIEAAFDPDNTNSWRPVAGPVYVIGNQFVVTNTTAKGQTFYRLREPQ